VRVTTLRTLEGRALVPPTPTVIEAADVGAGLFVTPGGHVRSVPPVGGDPNAIRVGPRLLGQLGRSCSSAHRAVDQELRLRRSGGSPGWAPSSALPGTVDTVVGLTR
jgi:hypothetical protein